jgi:hypothetical protein
LAVLSVISLVKNYLINFNVSDNGWKTLIVAILIVICLVSASISFSEAYTLSEINSLLSLPQTSREITEALERQIPIKTTNATVSICIGYVAYFLHQRLIKKIEEDKLKQIELNASKRWAGKI